MKNYDHFLHREAEAHFIDDERPCCQTCDAVLKDDDDHLCCECADAENERANAKYEADKRAAMLEDKRDADLESQREAIYQKESL